VLDGESFCTFPENDYEFEDALSLLASLLLRLTEAHVLCGLSLPRSAYLPQTDIAATAEIDELLTPLADYELLAERDEEASEGSKVVFLPSDFELPPLVRASRRAGRTYYIARDADGLRLRGFPQELDKTKLIMLTYRGVSDEDVYALGVRCLSLDSFGGQ
jgi:hypothetical protein